MTITEALEVLKALEEGATKGKWCGYTSQGGPQITLEPTRQGTTYIVPYVGRFADAALIAHVRNVLPQLLGVVEAAQCPYITYEYPSPCTSCDTCIALTALAEACEKEMK